MLKKGLVYAVPSASWEIYAACPMYAKSKQGKAKNNQESWMALLLNAPKSANRASTPVNASRRPPSVRHPFSLLRTKKLIAKCGEKAFKTV